MRLHAPQELAEAVVQEEAHGQARRIGRDAQDVKVHLRIQPLLLKGEGLPGAQGPGEGPKVLCAVAVVPQERTEDARIGGAGVLRPEEDGGIAQAHAAVGGGDQVVERGGICEGRPLADRRVEALFLAVGAERRRVE